MINAVNEQFSRFVNFAQERFDAGKTKADPFTSWGCNLCSSCV